MLVPQLEIAGRNFSGMIDGSGMLLFALILVVNWRQSLRAAPG
jgi:hypothetical protein